MKEHPILFSGPMVRAIIEGRKTMTRRVVKPQPTGEWAAPGRTMSPYGKIGDRLWVRETWCALDLDYNVIGKPHDLTNGPWPRVAYKVDHLDPHGDGPGNPMPWRPSIHMPRWASRITLEITSVRVERVQEITNQDAMNEGLPYAHPHRHGGEGLEFEYIPGEITKDPYADCHNTGINDCWLCGFRMLWDSINKKRGFGWDVNPWVWVIEFKRTEKGGPADDSL